MHTMTAKRDGVCSECDEEICEGVDQITNASGEWIHVHCVGSRQDTIAELEKELRQFVEIVKDMGAQIVSWQKENEELRGLLLVAINGKDRSDINIFRELVNEASNR